jgi:hypothetical protein
MFIVTSFMGWRLGVCILMDRAMGCTFVPRGSVGRDVETERCDIQSQSACAGARHPCCPPASRTPIFVYYACMM